MAFLVSGFPRHIHNALFFSILLTSMAAVLVSSFQFDVGGENGWTKPAGKESETYNEWAIQNRFHIGDTLRFKYSDDSVMEVSSADYTACNVSNPIAKFEDGETVFEFRRSGLFYFISGRRGHCKAGQRLIIRVMHPSEAEAEALSPAPSPVAGGGGGDGMDSPEMGTQGHNSTSKLSVASYFFTAIGGVMVFLYLLI